MKIGIIGAMDVEVSSLIEQSQVVEVKEIAGLKFYVLNYKGKDIYLVKSGIGKVNAAIATSILCLHYDVELVISTGIAGGMSPLKTGDICLVDKLYYGDVNCQVFNYAFGQVPGEEPYFRVSKGVLNKASDILKNNNYKFHIINSLTSDSFISSMPKLPLDSTFCFEMESTAITQTARHFNKEVLVIRYISDIVGEESQILNYTEFETNMAKTSSLITLKIVENL